MENGIDFINVRLLYLLGSPWPFSFFLLLFVLTTLKMREENSSWQTNTGSVAVLCDGPGLGLRCVVHRVMRYQQKAKLGWPVFRLYVVSEILLLVFLS